MIGVDQYRQGWPRLHNAVNDARGVLDMFEELGYQRAAEPLLNEAATHDALNGLVSELASLSADDSLIVFFAGHGHTAATAFAKRGFLIPADADWDNRKNWIRLDHWLSELADLDVRRILVILDSCYSGIALDSDILGRTRDPDRGERDGTTAVRCARRVISSSEHNQRAMDSGPVPGHSLFTGCLIKAVRGELARQLRQPLARVDELYSYVWRQVCSHSHQQQTPGSGVLEHDDRGEFLVPLVTRKRSSRRPPVQDSGSLAKQLPSQDRLQGPDRPRSTEDPAPVRTNAGGTSPHADTTEQARTEAPQELRLRRDQTESWSLDPAFVAQLDRHGAERARGYQVLSVIGGDPIATQTAWATWAARRGYLTLLSAQGELAAVIEDLLAQTPWLRCLTEARKRLAAAARLEVDAVDAALDARSISERRRWINDVAPLDRHALVSGWLLSALRESKAQALDLRSAPAQGSELLGIACDLAAPTAVLLHHTAPTEAWLAQAIGTAAALTPYLRRHSVAVSAPDDLVTRVLHGRHDSRALTMARQGRIALTTPAQRLPGRGRSRTMRVLHTALGSDPRTCGQFELDAQVMLAEGGTVIDVDLLAPRARIAVELDGWHHFYDPDGYRRDRDQDKRLQRAGYFVMRFLTEDVDDRIASTLDQIAIALAGRRASRALP